MQSTSRGMKYTFRPLDGWPRKATPAQKRRKATFSAKYSTTLKSLERELQYLGATVAVIQAAVDESKIRNDGLLYASARPTHPGIIVAFDSKHGPLQFACDHFDHWEANLRGIGLTLERLRLADLYGVTRSGEQYRGWQALPDPSQSSSGGKIDSRAVAVRFLAVLLGCGRSEIENDPAAAVRKAELATHPDRVGGDVKEFQRVQEAKTALGLA